MLERLHSSHDEVVACLLVIAVTVVAPAGIDQSGVLNQWLEYH